jgi:hypothetical protein
MKVYYKENIGFFIFYTIFCTMLFVLCWFSYNPEECLNSKHIRVVAFMWVLVWIVCTINLLWFTKFKK